MDSFNVGVIHAEGWLVLLCLASLLHFTLCSGNALLLLTVSPTLLSSIYSSGPQIMHAKMLMLVGIAASENLIMRV